MNDERVFLVFAINASGEQHGKMFDSRDEAMNSMLCSDNVAYGPMVLIEGLASLVRRDAGGDVPMRVCAIRTETNTVYRFNQAYEPEPQTKALTAIYRMNPDGKTFRCDPI